MTRLLAILAIVGWCLALMFFMLGRQHPDKAELTRLQLLLHEDSLSIKKQVAQVRKTDTVVQHQTDTVHKRVVDWQTAAGRVDTVHDTTTRDLVRSGDALQRSCTDLANGCQLFRRQAQTTIDSMSQAYHALDMLYQKTPKDRRWGISLFLGEGLSLEKQPTLHQVTGLALTYRIF